VISEGVNRLSRNPFLYLQARTVFRVKCQCEQLSVGTLVKSFNSANRFELRLPEKTGDGIRNGRWVAESTRHYQMVQKLAGACHYQLDSKP